VSDSGETAAPDVFCFDAVRQDIADPDKAGAEVEFRFVSDGDIELTIRWGDRDRGAYLISNPSFVNLAMKHVTDAIERRCERDPAYRAYMEGDMETWRRLSGRTKQPASRQPGEGGCTFDPAELEAVGEILDKYGITPAAIDAHIAAEQAGIADGTVKPIRRRRH
jgi:hypothetical protein